MLALLTMCLPTVAAQDLTAASLVKGDLLIFWQAGQGTTVTYRGVPLFAANPAELVVHRAWTDVYYRTENRPEVGTVTEGPDGATLTIRDRNEHFACEKRVTARADGSLRIEYELEMLDPEHGEIQVLWGIGKAWIGDAQYRLVIGGQERTGELKLPETGRIDPWGGATEQRLTTRYGTLSITSERPLNLLCHPDSGALWTSEALQVGRKSVWAVDVRVEPGAATQTGVRLAGLDWTREVRGGQAEFSLRLAREEGGPESVTIRAEPAAGSGAAPGQPVAVTLGPDPVETRCSARVEGRGDFRWAVVVLGAEGQELMRLSPLLLKANPYLRVLPRLSLYTSEPQAEIAVDLAEDLDPVGLAVAVSVGGQAEAKTRLTQRRTLISVPTATLPNGTTTVQCRLLRDEETLAEARTQLRKAPPRANEVKIDHLSRTLVVEGLPFIPFGYYTYYPLKAGVMDEEVVRGFNLFSPYHGGPHEAEQLNPIREYLDRCAAIGMKVNYHLMWPYRSEMTEAQLAEARREIEAVRDHPALLSWYIADEPGTEFVPQLNQVCSLLRELDPYHPVTIVFCQGTEHARQFSEAMDIVMADPYPIPSGPVTSVSSTADAFNAAFDASMPLWIVPQAFGGNEWWQREPTAQEQRVMTYLALIHGARAIQYFIRSPRVSFPKSPVMWAECGALAMEAAELTPALASPEVAPQVTSSEPSVHVCALQHAGVVTVLAANTLKRPQAVRLQVAGSDFTGEAEVLFEDRRVPVQGGAIEEMIDAYGTRAYAIPVGPLPADDLAIDPANLVVDPSWESTASLGTPAACYANIPPGATAFVDSRVARHGGHALRLNAPSPDAAPSLASFPVQLRAGKSYRVSLWAKSLHDGVGLTVSLGGLPAQQFTLTTAWQEYAYNVGPVEQDVRPSPGLGLTTPGTAWIDLFQIIPVP